MIGGFYLEIFILLITSCFSWFKNNFWM